MKENEKAVKMEESPAFRHSIPVQMRFNDIDVLGHINNSVYFSYYDLGKTAYFTTIRKELLDWQRADVVVANVNCNFYAPVYFGEPISVTTRVESIHEKSFKLHQRIVNLSVGALVTAHRLLGGPKPSLILKLLNLIKTRLYMIDIKQSMQEILAAESKAVANIPVTDGYEKAVAMIVEQVWNKQGKLITSGMGKAGQIAMNIATTFSSTGIPAVFLHPSEAQHGDLGVMQRNDIMLLLSNSGKTREIIELVALAKRMNPELQIIVITGNNNSELAEISDICLWTGNSPEVCPLGLTPTTSTTLMTVIGDVLVVNVMKTTGFTKEMYAMRHHGGYLGVKSRGENQ